MIHAADRWSMSEARCARGRLCGGWCTLSARWSNTGSIA